VTNYFWQNPILGANQRTRCRVVGELGDVNPVEYGGGFVLACTGGGRSEQTHEIEIAPYGQEEEGEDGPLTVFRVDIPEGDVWEDQSWAKPRDIARSMGMSERELRALGAAGATPLQKASAIEALAGYHGWHELDQYPLKFSPAELRRRWRSLLGRTP
jgi:hypothetical protein